MDKKQDFKWNEFGLLENVQDLRTYYSNRAYTHGKYCHYTKVGIINSILNKSLYLSCVDRFNDDCDKKQFGSKEEQKYFYSLCFATGETENLALWYLYSGINGKGGRICFTKERIENLIKNSSYALYEYNSKTKTLGKFLMELKQNETMDLRFQDIIYYQEEAQTVYLKYNTMTNAKISIEDFREFEKENKGFLKNTIWYYEKESRLLVELKNEAYNSVQKDKDYVVLMSFPTAFTNSWITIKFAPEIDEKDYWEEVNSNQNIKNFLQATSNLAKSDHAGNIHMDLCNNCDKICSFTECEHHSKNKKEK